MRTSILSLLILVLLCGCNAAQNTLLEASENNLTPVTTPTLYKYQPHKGTYRYFTKVHDLVNNVIRSSEAMADAVVSNNDNGLLWDINVTEATEGGTRVAPEQAIVTIQILTDEFGSGKPLQITSPWLDSQPGMEEKAKQLTEEFSKQLKANLVPSLSTTPIVSGQPLRVIDFSIKELGLPPGETMSLILEGEFTKDGSLYVLAGVDEAYSLNVQGLKVKMQINGYSIMKKDTMELVKSEVKMKFLSPTNEKLATASIIMEKL